MILDSNNSNNALHDSSLNIYSNNHRIYTHRQFKKFHEYF
jgi:hypothetical protein